MKRQAREDPVKEDKPQTNICKQYCVSRIYEELSKFDSKKTLTRKWANGRHFTKRLSGWQISA